MSRLTAEIVLEWGDGEYNFALKGRQIEQLENNHSLGIGAITRKVFTDECTSTMIRDIIHLGLEGGGMAPVEAARKMKRFFEGQPLAGIDDPSSPLATAKAVIGAAWFGVSSLKSAKGEAENTTDDPSINIAGLRGKMMEMGSDPSYADDHSIYEILSTFEGAVGEISPELSESDHKKMLELLAERKVKMGLT